MDADASPVNMELDVPLMLEALHSPPMAVHDVGHINDDFDVHDLKRDKQEQEEEERIGEEDVSNDSDGSDYEKEATMLWQDRFMGD